MVCSAARKAACLEDSFPIFHLATNFYKQWVNFDAGKRFQLVVELWLSFFKFGQEMLEFIGELAAADRYVGNGFGGEDFTFVKVVAPLVSFVTYTMQISSNGTKRVFGGFESRQLGMVFVAPGGAL